MHANQSMDDRSKRNTALDKRLEEIGWGLFLIMIGVIWLVPNAQVPQGIWLIGVAAIMIGLNAVRYLNGIKMHGFTIALGLLALAAGLGSLFGLKLPIFAILLILVGSIIIVKPLLGKKG